MSERARSLWLEGYLAQVVRRNTQLKSTGVDPARLGRYLEAVGLHSTTVISDQRVNEIAGISQSTGLADNRLLESLHVLTGLPAWSTRRVQRLVKTPKRPLIDAALVATLTQQSVREVMLDPEMKGRIIETFVAAQLRSEIPYATIRPHLYHMRDTNGRREVDLILEYPQHRIVGIEVKSSSTVTHSDAKHLAWLRDEIGESFRLGVVIHAGPLSTQLDDKIFAVRISACWTSPD